MTAYAVRRRLLNRHFARRSKSNINLGLDELACIARSAHPVRIDVGGTAVYPVEAFRTCADLFGSRHAHLAVDCLGGAIDTHGTQKKLRVETSEARSSAASSQAPANFLERIQLLQNLAGAQRQDELANALKDCLKRATTDPKCPIGALALSSTHEDPERLFANATTPFRPPQSELEFIDAVIRPLSASSPNCAEPGHEFIEALRECGRSIYFDRSCPMYALFHRQFSSLEVFADIAALADEAVERIGIEKVRDLATVIRGFGQVTFHPPSIEDTNRLSRLAAALARVADDTGNVDLAARIRSAENRIEELSRSDRT